MDRRRHEVSRAGQRIDLTPLEFQILDLLASEPGRAWSRNDLLDRVWSTEYEGYQRNIDPHINRLRKKLENDPKNPHYVLTVRGVGYKLNENPLNVNARYPARSHSCSGQDQATSLSATKPGNQFRFVVY